ncbi:hypothetical protein [Kitasatospora griseola]|uniref:hypothetical protein n=1 Tax=Kitasatospora griseola TaxID=2064 RepID=UPI00382480B7
MLGVPGCLRDLYGELDEALTALGEVKAVVKKHYTAYRRLRNLASVVFRPEHQVILLNLRLDLDTVEREEASRATCAGSVTLAPGAEPPRVR